MHSTNHISKSIYLTVIQLFQVSSPMCTLHTAISRVIIVLKRWISHLSYAIGIHIRLSRSNALIKWEVAMCNLRVLQETLKWLYCLLCLPVLIPPNSPDGPFNHILWQSLFIVPQGLPVNDLLVWLEDSLDHCTLQLMLEEEDLMEGWPE